MAYRPTEARARSIMAQASRRNQTRIAAVTPHGKDVMNEKSIRKELEGRIKELRSEATQLERVVRTLGSGSGRPTKARPKGSAPKTPAKRSKAGRSSKLTTDMLVSAFNGSDGSLSAAQLRARLRLPKSVSDFVLRKQLAEAVKTGGLKREGVARSTRYFLA